MEDGPPIFNQDFTCPDLLFERLHMTTFYLRGYHPLRLAFPNHSTKSFMLSTFRLLPFRSPLLGKSRLISFPLGTEMFQFPRFASLTYVFSQDNRISPIGFPHSDILGSMLVASSPGLFAGCHVFLRLLLPRHSPCALNFLTI